MGRILTNPWLVSGLCVLGVTVAAIFGLNIVVGTLFADIEATGETPSQGYYTLLISPAGLVLGLLLVGTHYLLRVLIRLIVTDAPWAGHRATEMALALVANPLIGLVWGLLSAAVIAVFLFQGLLSEVNMNDPVERGHTPLLLIPTALLGTGAGVVLVVWAVVIGLIVAGVYPWLIRGKEREA